MNSNKLAQVFHFDLYGKREAKYDFLNQNSLKSIDWNDLQPKAPNFFLVKKDFDESGMYEEGFKIDELFSVKSSGVKTHDDDNLVANNINELKTKVLKKGISFEVSKPQKYAYRPFDNGYVYYDNKILGRAREKTIYHLLEDNLGLNLVSQPQAANLNYFDCVFIANRLTDTNMFRRGGPVVFPLYLYLESKADLFATTERTPNLNQTIIGKMAEGLGIPFVAEKNPKSKIENPQSFAPIDVLDYIYAVLHSPAYREKYKEFLKIDFPRVPYPKDLTTFWKLVKLGGEIRQIHLLESDVVEEYITEYPEDGNNVVVKTKYENERVYINENQYFDKVPETAWNFYIGGYQPAQKWLKDRKERELSFEDILHYQKIIVALTETARIMQEIDLVGVE
ncbi:MAG: type ISP restriction/modification enzyme [Arcicella sp.]|nr:type ISP restriction/modification enzyme [Arcicella sp.]